MSCAEGGWGLDEITSNRDGGGGRGRDELTAAYEEFEMAPQEDWVAFIATGEGGAMK
jgi:hypothetical protein